MLAGHGEPRYQSLATRAPSDGRPRTLQRDDAPRLRCKELQQLAARDFAAEHRSAAGVRAVRVRNMLGDIQLDSGNLVNGRLPLVCSTLALAHRCRRGRQPNQKTLPSSTS